MEGLAAEIERSPAPTVYVANVMTQPGETDGYTTEDHLDAIAAYLDPRAVEVALVNDEPIPNEFIQAYREEGAEPVVDDLGDRAGGTRVVRAPVIDVAEIQGKETIKHDPEQLAQAVLGMATAEKGFAGGRRAPVKHVTVSSEAHRTSG